MTIRNEASVFTGDASEKRTARKGKSPSETNEATGEAFDVAVSGVAVHGTDTSRVEALDNNANNLSWRDLRKLRAARYERRNHLWNLTSLPRIRGCGRVRVSDLAGIKLVGGTATYSGLATCGSVWCCPVCSAKINASRSNDVKTAIDLWGMKDKSFVFQTLTMRHHNGQSLAELWAGLSFAWQRLNSGAIAKREVSTYGQMGFIRVVEITHGKNGWHIHIHMLRFLGKPITDEQVKQWSEQQFLRWSKALSDKGLATPLREAQDFKLTRNAEDLAKYLTKQANYGGKLGMELTSQETKKAKLGGRKPFEILDDYISNPTGSDKDLWLEYEKASKGKKQTHWSNGLRTMLGIDYEKSDDELSVQEENESVVETMPVVCITNDGMRTLTSNRRWQHEALTVAELSGERALERYLVEIGVEYYKPVPEPRDWVEDYHELRQTFEEFSHH
jgi:hypothetical protein